MTLYINMYGKPLTLFDTSKHLLGYDRLDEGVHREWCDTFEDSRRRGVTNFCRLEPRGTYKSTIFTCSLVIDLLLEDYITNGKFTKRILIASSTETLARNLLSEIKQHLTKNQTLLDIFDPARNGYLDRDNQTGIWFKKAAIHKEANIACIGAGSAITSSHYEVIICDDIVSNEDRESVTIRDRKHRWFIDLISIIEPKDNLMFVIGTRWAKGDVLDTIIETNDELPDAVKYDIVINGVYNADGSLRYPSIYDEDKLEELKIKKGKIEFASQYLNLLLSEDTIVFDINEFAFYKEGDQREAYKIDFDFCQHFIYIDPSLGVEQDYTVLIIGAIYKERLYIREVTISNTLKPSRLITLIQKKYYEYNCTQCGFETNGFQSLIVDQLKEENEKSGHKRKIKIKEVKNYKNKKVRIESVEPFVTSGRIVFRDDWDRKYPLFIEQICNYPIDRHDDAPDALEGISRLTINKKSNTNTRNNALAKFLRGVKR